MGFDSYNPAMTLAIALKARPRWLIAPLSCGASPARVVAEAVRAARGPGDAACQHARGRPFPAAVGEDQCRDADERALAAVDVGELAEYQFQVRLVVAVLARPARRQDARHAVQ